MKLFDFVFNNSPASDPNIIYMPVQGQVIPLEKIPDPVFAEGMVGPGCGIQPTGDTVYAPCAGTINVVASTLHAVGLTSESGIELLIHVGMDTVSMRGKGFRVYVKEGQRVTRGQKLLTFNPDAILADGHALTSAVVICNADEVGMPTAIDERATNVGDILMKVQRKEI